MSKSDEQFYDFEDIVSHVWVGSRLCLEVKWKDGTSTFEPESSLKEDDPHTLASYLQRPGLSSRSKRCQWANSAVYNTESTGGGSGGDSVNLSSDEEAGDTTKREAPGSDPGEHSDAKFFAVRSFGASCTLSSGAIFLSHQDAVEHAAANHMEQPGNNVKGFDNIDDALSFASSLVEKKEPIGVVAAMLSALHGGERLRVDNVTTT